MKPTKQKIIDYAETLYCQYDDKGCKVYSLRDIEKKILLKHNKNTTHTTVREWAIKYDWDKTNAKIKQQSIAKAQDDNFTSKEQIIERESDKLANTYKNAEQLERVGFEILFKAYKGEEHPLIPFDSALRALKLGSDIKFRVLEVPDNTNENIIIVKGV